MNLIKTAFLSAIASAFKIVFGFILTKLLAVYGGASEIAILGQVQSAQQMMSGTASAGFENGLIKYISEFKGERDKIQLILATAFRLVSLFVVFVAALVFVFSDEFSEMALNNANDVFFLWLVIALPVAVMGILLQAVLNGYREVRKLVGVGICTSIIGMLLALWLVPSYGLSGAVAVFLLGPVSAFFLSVYMLSTVGDFSFGLLWGTVDRESARKLSKFTIMTIATALTLPLGLMILRTYLGTQLSWEDAGIWTGMWRISDGYLTLITMTLTVYYLPRLSEIQNQSDLNKEILHGQKIILPLVALLALSVYVFRDQVIILLFDDSFDSMADLFAPQLVGDVISIAGWLYGDVLFAKADVFAQVSIQVLLTISFLLLGIIMTDAFGLVGISYAFAINSMIFLLVVYSYFRMQCKKNVYNGVAK